MRSFKNGARLADKFDMTKVQREIAERNLIAALELGVIDWFQYFERWRELDAKPSE